MSATMDGEVLDRLDRSPNFCAIGESSGDHGGHAAPLDVLEQGGKFVRCIRHGPPRRPLQPLDKDDRHEPAKVIRAKDIAIAAIEKGTTT